MELGGTYWAYPEEVLCPPSVLPKCVKHEVNIGLVANYGSLSWPPCPHEVIPSVTLQVVHGSGSGSTSSS